MCACVYFVHIFNRMKPYVFKGAGKKYSFFLTLSLYVCLCLSVSRCLRTMQSADHSLKFFFSCSARQSLRGRKKTHTGRVALHPVKYRLILYSIFRVYFTAYSGYTLQHTQMETHNYSTATSPPRSVPIISRHTRQMKSQNTRHHIILYSRALPSLSLIHI